MNKKEVAAALDEIATLMELAGENAFKIRSYTNGARTIEQLDEDLELLVQEKRLRDLKGVGEALEQKIEELVTTGKLKFLEDLRAQFPESLFELFGIPSLGPKRIKAIYDELDIDSLDKLERACRAGKLQALKGFSDKLEAKILEGIAFSRKHTGQFLYNIAYEAAERLLHELRELPEVQRLELAGSLRRCKETVKDIDIVVSSDTPEPIMERFVKAPEVVSIVGHGKTKLSVVLESGIGVDLRVVSDAQFPFALAHFTGSKEHNIVMRQRAKDRDLKLNEYGLHREDGAILPCKTEADIFEALDLPFIPPELREDRNEFELTETPPLVTMDDLHGVLHCHSLYSDGANTIEQMATTARAMDYSYILMSDHSQSAGYAGGLKPDDILRQHAEIDTLNADSDDFIILKGIESDIRVNGDLDYEEDILRSFDLVIVSVHNKLGMDLDEATARTIKAIEHPCTHILGHPTGRLLLQREGFPLDMEKVMDACAANGVAIEINANCKRLDLDWRHLRQAKEKGIKLAICPDAHSVAGLECIRYGVGIARKGGLEPGDILNCMTAKELLAWRK